MRRTPVLVLALLLLVAAVSLVATTTPADAAYKAPKTGTWKLPSYFDSVKNGSMKIVKKKGKLQVKKLTIKLGTYTQQECGAKKISLVKPAKIKVFGSYKRYAVGKMKKGLIVGKGGHKFKLGKKKIKGKLKLIFDESGKMATSALIETKACNVSFYSKKK